MTKRLLATAAVFLLSLVASVGLWADTKGKVTDNVSWTLTDDGKLTITGTGAMPDFAEYGRDVPWYSQRDAIREVEIGEGITNIGSNAFYGCDNLTETTISASVAKIGSRVFYSHSSLKKITALPAVPPACEDLSFDAVAEDCALYVPAEAIGQYASASGWYRFSSCVKSLTPRLYAVMTLDASTVWSLELHYDCGFNASHFLTCQIDNLAANFTVPGIKAMIGSELYAGHFDELGKIIIKEGFENYKPTSCRGMFAGLENLKTIEGLERLNTADVTDMSEMFNGCYSLEQIDLSSMNTEQVVSMDWMFNDLGTQCDILVGDGFTLKNVSSSDRMFGYGTSAAYARYDTADGLLLKKVGMLGGRPIGAHGTPLAIDRLALDDSGDFALTETETVVAAAATYSRTLTSQWGTLCLPYAISTAESNCRFYSISDVTDEVGYPSDDEADGVVYLKETEGDIPAGTPLLFCLKDDTATDRTATVAGKGELTGKAGTTVIYDDEDDNVDFVGVFGNTVLTSAHDRFFAGGYFRPVYNDKVRIPAFRAYLNVKVDESAPSTYSLAIGGSTTGISAAEAVEGIVSGKAEYYTTDGRRTDGLHRGMNIVRVGGKTKKIFVR